MFIFVNLLQLAKQPSLIASKSLGKITSFSDVQFLKAVFPIVLILFVKVSFYTMLFVLQIYMIYTLPCIA